MRAGAMMLVLESRKPMRESRVEKSGREGEKRKKVRWVRFVGV